MSMHEFDAAMTRAAGRPRFLAGPGEEADTSAPRLAANFAAIEAELDAPNPGLLARVLVRLGVGEGTVPLVTATPAPRRKVRRERCQDLRLMGEASPRTPPDPSPPSSNSEGCPFPVAGPGGPVGNARQELPPVGGRAAARGP